MIDIHSPENQALLATLLYNPNAVSFVVRSSEYFDTLVQENPDIAIAQILAGRYIICYTSRTTFESLITQFGTSFISSISIVLGLLQASGLEAAGILQIHEQPYLDLRGQGVLIGFVDTGIDYTLEVFRYEDGSSKIQYIYDMTVEGPPPEGFFMGTEYNNAMINAALLSGDPLSIVPEEDTAGHGTFLASVAAGRPIGDFAGAAPDAEIIMVKLRRASQFYFDFYAVPQAQQNAFESSSVMIGIEYILAKARELGRPVAICIGIGSNFGSHDPFTLFNEYLSGVSNLVGVCLCSAVGNESQARHHTQGLISAEAQSQNIDIRVGDNAGDIFITIWNGISDRISIGVRSPTGEFIGRIPAISGLVVNSKLVLERSSVQIAYFFPLEGSGGQITTVKIIDATPGIWNITLYGDIILDGIYHAWLPLTGFIDPSVEFFAATPYHTVTSPSTMIGSIVCGAYNAALNSLYARSSWGPTTSGNIAPDLVAPGVGISGFYPYGAGTMDGTSVATAITAGAGALMLQWGFVNGNDPTISTYQIRAYMIRGCVRNVTAVYPNNQWGYGKLNLIQTFNLMREL